LPDVTLDPHHGRIDMMQVGKQSFRSIIM
jgi:hypothetical protein